MKSDDRAINLSSHCDNDGIKRQSAKFDQRYSNGRSLELVMAKRNWPMVTNDLSILLFGIQHAALMAQNMVLAAESLGLGTCFLGGAAYGADKIKKQYRLPDRVFPLVQLAVGYRE